MARSLYDQQMTRKISDQEGISLVYRPPNKLWKEKKMFLHVTAL